MKLTTEIDALRAAPLTPAEVGGHAMTNEHKRAPAAEVDPDGMFERAYAEAAGVAHEASRPRAANPQTEARAIAHRLSIHHSDEDRIAIIATALAAKDAELDGAVFLKDAAEAALVKRESELVAKNAELAAVKENCETVCNSYADENQRLYDRAERAEAQLAEAIDLLGSSLCEMAPISAENHKRRVIEFITARRALEEQGGE